MFVWTDTRTMLLLLVLQQWAHSTHTVADDDTRKTISSATAEIARDADVVDYRFSKVTVHLTKNAIEYRSN